MERKHGLSPGTDSGRSRATPKDSLAVTRRELLRDAAAVLGLGMSPLAEAARTGMQGKAGQGRKKWPEPRAGQRQPRFRRRKNKGNAYRTNLPPGFYLNAKSQVIHYVSADRKIAKVYRINERNLRPLKVTELVMLLAANNKPRVSLATASHAFEQAALAALSTKNYGLACQLLTAAIRHDQYFKQATREEPSFRLYDMLAGVALRFGQPKWYDEAIRLARVAQQRLGQAPVRRRVRKVAPRPGVPARRASHPPRAHRKLKKARKQSMKAARAIRVRRRMETSLSKWQAVENSWKRQWRDLRRPLPWKERSDVLPPVRGPRGAGVLR